MYPKADVDVDLVHSYLSTAVPTNEKQNKKKQKTKEKSEISIKTGDAYKYSPHGYATGQTCGGGEWCPSRSDFPEWISQL